MVLCTREAERLILFAGSGGIRKTAAHQARTPDPLEGLAAELNVAQGTGAISPTKRTAKPDECEYDIGFFYRAPTASRLRGWSVEAAAGIVELQGGGKPSYQIRLIVNWEIPLL